MNFEKLPDNLSESGQFAKLFKELNNFLEASKVQGFKWDQLEYDIKDAEGNVVTSVTVDLDENTYLVLSPGIKNYLLMVVAKAV